MPGGVTSGASVRYSNHLPFWRWWGHSMRTLKSSTCHGPSLVTWNVWVSLDPISDMIRIEDSDRTRPPYQIWSGWSNDLIDNSARFITWTCKKIKQIMLFVDTYKTLISGTWRIRVAINILSTRFNHIFFHITFVIKNVVSFVANVVKN